MPILFLNLAIFPSLLLHKLITHEETWTAEAQLVLPDANRLDASLGVLGSLESGDIAFTTQINPLKLQRSIMFSDAVMTNLLESDPERADYKNIEAYKKLFTVTFVEQSPVIVIQATAPTPDLAEQRLHVLIENHQTRIAQLRANNSQYRDTQSKEQLSIARENLARAQRALADYRESSGLVDPAQQTEEIVATASLLNQEYVRLSNEADGILEELSVLTQHTGLNPNQAVQVLGLDQNQAYQRIRQNLIEVNVALAEEKALYTDQHPSIQQLERRRSELQTQLQRSVRASGFTLDTDVTISSGGEGKTALIERMLLLEGEFLAREKQAENLESVLNELSARLSEIPQAESRLQELQRQYEFAEGAYKGLVAQVEQSRIDAFSTFPIIQVLDPPSAFSQPDSSNLMLTLAYALIACLTSSAGLLIYLEGRDPLLLPEDLDNSYFSLVSNLPYIKSNSTDLQAKAEFQWLASNFASQNSFGSICTITSAMPEEGRTCILLGLGKALSNLGYRVLLVDGGIGTNALSKHFGVIPVSDIEIQPVPVVSGTDILPFASNHPYISELAVAQDTFKAYVEKILLENNYDFALIDTPPIVSSTLSLLLASSIKHSLFVVRSGYSKRSAVMQALKQLLKRNVKFSALVHNCRSTAETKHRVEDLINTHTNLSFY